MNAEWAAIWITIVGALGTGFNLWLSLRIDNKLLQLELRLTNKFVTTDDLESSLAPLRQSIQLVWSRRSLQEKGDERITQL